MKVLKATSNNEAEDRGAVTLCKKEECSMWNIILQVYHISQLTVMRTFHAFLFETFQFMSLQFLSGELWEKNIERTSIFTLTLFYNHQSLESPKLQSTRHLNQIFTPKNLKELTDRGKNRKARGNSKILKSTDETQAVQVAMECEARSARNCPLVNLKPTSANPNHRLLQSSWGSGNTMGTLMYTFLATDNKWLQRAAKNSWMLNWRGRRWMKTQPFKV